MYYQIKYGQAGQAKRISTAKVWAKYMAFALIGAALCWSILWSTGMDWGVTVDALEQMAIDLGDGENLKEAFSGFCLEILKGAECG